MRNQDLVSVIVTTKNEASVLTDLLTSVAKQTYKAKEVILVDNASVDSTIDIARKYKIRIYQFGPERSAQRNYGAKMSNGKYLLFLDADMKLAPKVIEACVEGVTKDREIAAIAIPEQSIAFSFWEKVKAFERSFYNEKGDPITDAARFFRKEAFNKAGGYDETITGPEDWDLPESIRELGYKTARISEKIYHRERAVSLISLFRKKFYYGLHAHKYLKKHKISLISPKTVYFLRPLFYQSWKRLTFHPLLAIGMIIMLLIQTLGGGLGYVIGRIWYSKS